MHFAGLLSDGGVHSLQEHLHGTDRRGAGARRGERVRPRHPRRPRHAAEIGRDVPRPAARAHPRQAERASGHGHRPLLHDGPRPALGARAARLRPDDARRRHGDEGSAGDAAPFLRAGRHRRVHGADLGPHAGRRAPRPRRRRRRADLLQLPRGPHAPDRHRVQGRGLRRLRSRACIRRRGS